MTAEACVGHGVKSAGLTVSGDTRSGPARDRLDTVRARRVRLTTRRPRERRGRPRRDPTTAPPARRAVFEPDVQASFAQALAPPKARLTGRPRRERERRVVACAHRPTRRELSRRRVHLESSACVGSNLPPFSAERAVPAFAASPPRSRIRSHSFILRGPRPAAPSPSLLLACQQLNTSWCTWPAALRRRVDRRHLRARPRIAASPRGQR